MNRMGKDYQRFTDQQGNILSVVDENGGRVFDATYDAWGRQTVTLNRRTRQTLWSRPCRC